MSHTTNPKPKTPLDYETAFSKGRKLAELMQSQSTCPGTASAPPNFTMADLNKYGWVSRRYGADEILDEHADFLASLKTDTYVRQDPYDGSGGDNIDITTKDEVEVTVDSVLYPATEGYFSSVMNWKAGLLIAVNNSSPESRIKSKKGKASTANPPPSTALMPLRHWSDIAYLQWKQLPSMGVSPSPLRYILRANVQNPDSVAVMSRILGFSAAARYNGSYPPRPRWPGISYDISTREAQALLGTPNGMGVGYLLAQHGSELGAGCVEKVTIFFSSGQHWEKPNVLFWLGGANYEGNQNETKEKAVIRVGG